MRFEKQLRPHWAREQTVNLTEQNTKVLRRQELRRDFTGESTLRPTAEFLFEAFEAARPSSRELLRTRTCWPVGFEADRSDLGGVLYQPFGHSLAIDDLDHQERSDVLGHLPEDVNAAPASSLVLEAAIDFIQLGLAVEDSGVEFASLITSETEVRIGNELRCQIANSRSSDGGDHVALSLIENHANFTGDADPLQQVLLSMMELMQESDLRSRAEKAVRSLSKGEDEAARALSRLATLFRNMRSPQMASAASRRALSQKYARLAVSDLSADDSHEAQYRFQVARKQIAVEDWLESLDHFDRKRETNWLEELHGDRALFINDHRPELPDALTLDDQPLDPISAAFISDQSHRVMSRALHGQLGDALFDPLTRHIIQMELNDRPPPMPNYRWGNWDPERGVFPIKMSCPWPEDLDIQAMRLERTDGSSVQFWLQARDFEDPHGTVNDSVAPGHERAASYRAAWLAELPGSEIFGEWSPTMDIEVPTVPNRTAQYLAKMRGPTSLDRVVDDTETLQRRIRLTKKTRAATLRAIARSAAVAFIAIASWLWVIPAAIDAATWLAGLI